MIEDNELTRLVIGAAIQVHREMGPGLLESIYQACLEIELRNAGIDFVSQYRLPLVYKGQELKDNLVLDIYIPGRLIVELKAVEHVLPVHEAQLLTYLKLSHTHIGLLINFNVPVLKDGLKRIIL
ncbi:GxxExxY protein [Aquisphaera insulae]|uniref:GxxExxY protein n=1 Tax=Aquisphaera insulae TaxID=2712864 RepID=UPI0013ED44A4|nr:GxxExxY protein [Aquisphaera insulae]